MGPVIGCTPVMEEAGVAVLVICCLVFCLGIVGMLLKFSTLCVSKDVGSLESLYRRRSTKPMVEEAPDHLKMIPEHTDKSLTEPESRISVSGCRQVSCPEFEIQLLEKTRN